MKVFVSFAILLIALILVEEGFGARSPEGGRNGMRDRQRKSTTEAPALIRPVDELKATTSMDLANRNPIGNRSPPPYPRPTPPQ